MRKMLSLMFGAVLLVSQLALAAPELRNDHPDRYTVVKGDTLWDISSRFLKNPWYWPEIWHVNPQVENPHLIFPGDVLALVYIDGQPRVTIAERGAASRTIKLTPEKRITPLESAIPAIPLEAIQPFLTDNRVVQEEDLLEAPYVLLGKKGNLIVGAGDQVYARGEAKVDESYGIYRRGQVYIDPETEEFLGVEARSIALGRVTEGAEDVVTVQIRRTSEEIRQGDRLLQEEDREISSTYYPSNPDREIRGRMIAVLDGVSQIGQYDVVVINKGVEDGLKEGNVLAVYKVGEQVRDPYTKEILQLPSDRAGILMIFRVFDRVSYGLILKAERPLAIMDEVRNP
ncbi:peptidoglycan-binding protein [Hahella sp. CCB-MM4]|uniref:LysM peptidoglycan-binding domain-containing protein n=1 Tax=Hahella sp. (strain CCB-MM4) TaxID=1926491 RepID=UPI000B9BEC35|nr:LysM peptidoglycan-binding domain-containing protein [Hahella sp. CCB-MM4]OZG73257.1 peptidoglycan-binding protein [Hahella sp. CCB-MM4]